MRRSRLWWLLAAVPLAYLPLAAQEAPAPADAPVESGSPPAAPPVEEKSPPVNADGGQRPAPRDEPPDERVSADNNLSFPVDI